MPTLYNIVDHSPVTLRRLNGGGLLIQYVALAIRFRDGVCQCSPNVREFLGLQGGSAYQPTVYLWRLKQFCCIACLDTSPINNSSGFSQTCLMVFQELTDGSVGV